MLSLRLNRIIIMLSLITAIASCGRHMSGSKSEEAREPLVRFESDERFGFKDVENEIEIKAKYSRTDAHYFDEIVIVEEKTDKATESYYLSRSGKKFGTDQVYTYGYNYDCEREGYIRFKDPFSSNVGLYNSQGKVIIPAIYDDLSPVTFGLVSAIKNAEKSVQHSQQTYSFGYKYYRDHLSGGCNHISWSGGIKLLLNTDGDILIKNFNYKGRLDYSSLVIQNEASTEETKESFKGVNGKYYVFINIEKHFKEWFKAEFLNAGDELSFSEHSMDSIMYYRRPDGWMVESKSDFLDENEATLIDRLSAEKRHLSEMSIRLKELSPLSYDRPYFRKYYNNCNKGMKDKYPLLEVKQYLVENDTEYKTVLKFLKTEKGYMIFDIRVE